MSLVSSMAQAPAFATTPRSQMQASRLTGAHSMSPLRVLASAVWHPVGGRREMVIGAGPTTGAALKTAPQSCHGDVPFMRRKKRKRKKTREHAASCERQRHHCAY